MSRIDPAKFVRGGLRELHAYTLDRVACRHKLDQNELPFELPARAKRAALAALAHSSWGRYPDVHAEPLREALAARHGWPAAGILVGNGANELLELVVQAIVPPGGEILGIEPSFGLYPPIIAKAGGRYRALPCDASHGLPLAALAAAVELEPERPLLLCSPNNPTGEAVAPEVVARLAGRLAAPLVLDNAYGEFSQHDYRPLLADLPNVILLRTFSKAWALAGLRVGYLLADPRFVSELVKAKLPYNLGHAAQAAALAALGESAATERRLRLITGRRAQWLEMLREAGLDPLPSEANFVLVRCGDAARARRLYTGLSERGIRVRDVGSGPGLTGCLRITVGTGVALRATRQALAEIAQGVPVRPAVVPGVPKAPQVSVVATAPAVPAVAAADGRRCGEVRRVTGETTVTAKLCLDGGPRRIAVPNGFFAHLLDALATHAGLGLELAASGDLAIDLHHTVEDVGIVLGDALAAALGERRGIARFGSALAPLDEALAEGVVDLGGRAHFAYRVPAELAAIWVTAEFPLSLIADFFQAFADRGRLNLHLEIRAARNGHHAAEAAFKAVALALRTAIARRGGAIPSTKGTLTR